MKKSILRAAVFLICVLLSNSIFASAQDFLWGRSSTNNEYDFAFSVAVDQSSNVFVAGTFKSQTRFTGSFLTSAGDDDIFLAKFNSAGTLLWNVSAGGAGYDVVKGLAVDAAGDVYMTGNYRSNATFGATTLILPSTAYENAFVAKYSGAGTSLWAKAINGSVTRASGLVVDGQTNIITAGIFGGTSATATFDTITLTNPSPGAISPVYVAKYDRNGNVLWAQFMGEQYKWQQPLSIAVDTNLNLFLAGLEDDRNFPSATNAFLLKLNSSGNFVWGVTNGRPCDLCGARVYGTSVAVDSTGNAYLAGSFSGNPKFGSTNLSTTVASAGFVAKYALNGSLLWVQQAGSAPSQFYNSAAFTSIKVEPDGNVLAAGNFWGNLLLGNGSWNLTSTGDDIFLCRLDSSGNVTWAVGSVGSNGEYVTDLALNGKADGYLVGQLNGNMTFGSSSFSLSGLRSAFVVRFGPVVPVAPVITSQPTNQIVLAGDDVIVSVTANGLPPPAYQWQFNQTNIPGATGSTLLLPGITTNQAGSYRVIVSNEVASVTSQTATLIVTPVPTLAEALDNPGLVWTNGGNARWFSQEAITHDGIDAAQSGAIGNNQQTWMETTVSGPGSLTFWWKVSSESGYDFLEFYINGSRQTLISGEVNWQKKSYTLASGSQTLRWRYAKDSSSIGGQDKAWVDEVVFTPPAPQPFTLSSPQRLGDGSFRWTLNGESGRSYTVQASTNLTGWNDLQVVVPNSSSFQITDTNAPGYQLRFYRLRTP